MIVISSFCALSTCSSVVVNCFRSFRSTLCACNTAGTTADGGAESESECVCVCVCNYWVVEQVSLPSRSLRVCVCVFVVRIDSNCGENWVLSNFFRVSTHQQCDDVIITRTKREGQTYMGS